MSAPSTAIERPRLLPLLAGSPARVLLLRLGAARGAERDGRGADARLRRRRRRAGPSLRRLLLWLCRHADPRRPAARPLRPAPPDDGLPPWFARRLRAVRHRRHACRRHRRPLPDRRLRRLQPGRRHGRCRTMVRPDRFAMLSGLAMAPAWRAACSARRRCDCRRSLRLAHHHAAARRAAASPSRSRPGRPCATSGAAAAASAACSPASARVRHPPDLADRAGRAGTSSPLLGFAGLWGVPFLEAAYGLPRTQAATLTSMMFVGWGVGAPLFGWLSDRIGRRRPPMLVGLILETAALVAARLCPGPAGVRGRRPCAS